ncbi:MAG: ABC transporter ATP-binding protein [Acidobacteria bacterium]|nr:ABC transporter ATP-binding protein [Acidobacteriota bacterium]
MASVIELRAVSKSHGGKHAVREISLSIGEGEFFALLGPSGCGKSTTLGMIAGFVEPDAGEVYICGQNMVGVPPHRRNVNTVFQNYALFPHMTVADNVAFGLRMKRMGRSEIAERVREMLEMVSLSGFGDRKPAHLSGGEQQRIALARALVNLPAVLLLDEPLGALDLKLRKQMQVDLIAIQRKFGITFVYVTHDQEEAMSMADRIAVMDKSGKAAQVGTPQEIYRRPSNRFVADFTGAANFFSGVVKERGDGNGALVECEHGLTVRTVMERSGPLEGPVHLSVRPEMMALAARQGNCRQNWLAGEVVKASYLGNSMQYLVRWPGGTLLITRPLSSAAAEAPFDTGQTVWVSWSPENTVVVAE